MPSESFLTLIFKLKPEISILEVISFLKTRQAYEKFVRHQCLDEVWRLLELNEDKYKTMEITVPVQTYSAVDNIDRDSENINLEFDTEACSAHQNNKLLKMSEKHKKNLLSSPNASNLFASDNHSSSDQNVMYHDNSNQLSESSVARTKDSYEKSKNNIDDFIEKVEELER